MTDIMAIAPGERCIDRGRSVPTAPVTAVYIERNELTAPVEPSFARRQWLTGPKPFKRICKSKTGNGEDENPQMLKPDRCDAERDANRA
ncbi:hypothetical protein NGM99_10835 [Mesorhizobium sp. RP14(2022)]|uniref:Uncharacterized protein n=1 Tax=Mesorhizobium liriopis TaxID=2953882 RepID=A0ABT1C624_9HYPH|nr:hypothetical protein [Mesorhizobium liriopis]MCO6050279.1 hypothetical protein [Mesorhizobium liriopis]